MGLILQLAKTASQNIYPQLPETAIKIILGCRSRETLAGAYLRNSNFSTSFTVYIFFTFVYSK
jgi:hypothetical protein